MERIQKDEMKANICLNVSSTTRSKNNSTYVFHQNVSLLYQEMYFGAQEAPFVPASVRIVVLIY